MKINIITRHNIINYGSVLQSYALQHVLEIMGHQVEIIDYVRKDEEYKNIALVLAKNKDNRSKNVLKKAAFIIGKSIEFMLCGARFRKYACRYLHLTATRYSSLTELKKENWQCDALMTGSDQVWGGIGNDYFDPAYYLDFGSVRIPKFSYAASFGRTDLDTDVYDRIPQYLKQYKRLTAREDSAVDILHKLGFPQAEQVLDPTLLLTPSEWDKVVSREPLKKDYTKEKYILVYQRRPNKTIDNYASQLGKVSGLKVYRISSDLHQIFRPGDLVFLPNFHDFIECIKHSSLLVTDSFHGTAFAINYNVPFVDILPKGTATRNLSILQLCNLKDRVVSDLNDFSYIDKTIDFSFANDVLSRERKRSIDILHKMLNSVSKYGSNNKQTKV